VKLRASRTGISLIVRGVPGTVWVRPFASWSGWCVPSWTGKDLYNGSVRRYAWTVKGYGVGIMWMRRR
jgi:hypothetical protein